MTLTATADARARFDGWTGPTCAEGTQLGTNCTLTMNQSRTTSARFGFIVD